MSVRYMQCNKSFLKEQEAAYGATAHIGREKPSRSKTMSKTIRFQVALAAVVLFAGTVSFAQSAGEATYKAKCQMCHGAKGMADTGAGKAMKVKPATNPEVKALSEEKMIDAVEKGTGKMQAYKGKLTDAEIKDAVSYFRTFSK